MFCMNCFPSEIIWMWRNTTKKVRRSGIRWLHPHAKSPADGHPFRQNRSFGITVYIYIYKYIHTYIHFFGKNWTQRKANKSDSTSRIPQLFAPESLYIVMFQILDLTPKLQNRLIPPTPRGIQAEALRFLSYLDPWVLVKNCHDMILIPANKNFWHDHNVDVWSLPGGINRPFKSASQCPMPVVKQTKTQEHMFWKENFQMDIV